MRILFTNNAPLIKFGLSSGFRNLGHDVFIMDKEYQLWDKNKELQFKIFKEVIEIFRPDLVFSECFAEFSELIFEYTNKMGIPHFYWAIEDTPNDHWIGDYWSDYTDYIFTTTAECLPNYWKKGKNAELLLFGCNPNFHKKIDVNIDNDIVLVANNYDRRSKQVSDFLIPLLQNNYNVRVYGNNWWIDGSRKIDIREYCDCYHGLLSYEKLPLVYSSSKIALGFNLDDCSYTQTSMRMYEVLGSGGALLVSCYTKAQEFLFHDYIYLPKNTDELFDMVNEILSMTDEQRKEKAKQAQEFVYKHHNYTLRAKQVLAMYRQAILEV